MARLTVFTVMRLLLLQQCCFNVAVIAEGAPGEACKAADSTCDGDLVCQNDVCKVKVGVDCDANDKCVANGQCGDGSSSGPCQCLDDFVPKSDKTACLAKIGQPCTDKADCVTSAGVCTATAPKQCACDATKVATDDNTECKLKEGEVCTNDDECAANAHCPAPTGGGSQTCQCKDGFTKQASGKCFPPAKIGEACTSKSDCVPSADECSAGGQCACTGNNVAMNDNTACKLKEGQVCTDNNECATNAHCPAATGGGSQTCQCKDGFTKQASGKCFTPAKIGEACTDMSDCVASADECSAGGQCACTGDNVAMNDNTACKLKEGQVCTDNNQCATNAHCPAATGGGSQTCQCKDGFTKQASGKCSGAAAVTASVLLLTLTVLVTSRFA